LGSHSAPTLTGPISIKKPKAEGLFIEKFGCFLAMVKILVTVMSQEIYIL
jgi:hypothetical protein